MKWLDQVRVTSDAYENVGVKKGAIDTIIFAWMRYDQYEVVFSLPDGRDYADEMIYLWDLEVVCSSDITDEDILEDLPEHNPKWWCKVENGFILNLCGERKNKIAFDYKS